MPAKFKVCVHCGASVPLVELSPAVWQAIKRSLSNGSSTMAIAEIVSLTGVSQHDATQCLEHLRCCIFSWPLEASLREVMAEIDSAFGDIAKPQHFTNFAHCRESLEHDDVLRSQTVKTIARSDLGNVGWNPMTFANGLGRAYYFPALARYAAIPSDWPQRDSYIDLLACNLGGDPKANKLFQFCNSRQREGIASLMDWLSSESENAREFNSAARSYAGWPTWADGAALWRA